MMNFLRVMVWLWWFPAVVVAQSIDETRQNQGLQEHVPQTFALTGGKLILGDGRTIPSGVILVQGDKIVGLGAVGELAVPAGFRQIDLTGKTIYPGFLDAYRPVPVDLTAYPTAYWNSQVRPELDVRDSLTPELTEDTARRSQGIVAAAFAPTGAILDGSGAVANLGGWSDQSSRRLVRSAVGQHGVLTVTRGPRPAAGGPVRGDNYPSSPMGAVALARQALYDARWYRDAWQVVRVNPQVSLPETNRALEAFEPLLQGDRALFVRTGNELAALRADRFAREFGLGLVLVGSGREYRRLEDVVATGRPIICPLNFPPAPNVATVAQSHAVTLESLLHWDHAPENPARLAQAQVRLAFTTMGLESPNTFLKQVRTAVQRGLDPAAALRALTVDAAQILGVSEQLGSLATGKLASFVVADGDLFDAKTILEQTWVAGKPYELKPAVEPTLAGTWDWEVAPAGEHPAWSVRVEFKQRGDQWTASIVPPAAESKPGPQAEDTASDPATDPAGEAADKLSAENEDTDQSTEQASTEDDRNQAASDESAASEVVNLSAALGEVAQTEQRSQDAVAEQADPQAAAQDPPKPTNAADSAVKFDRLRFDGLALSGTAQGPGLPRTGVARWNIVIDDLQAKGFVGRFLWPDGTAATLTIQRSVEAAPSSDKDQPSTESQAPAATAAASIQPGPATEADNAEVKSATEAAPATGRAAGRANAAGRRGRPAPEAAVAPRASFPVNYPLGMYGRTELSAPRSSVLFRNFTVWTSGPDGILEGGSVWVVDGRIRQVVAQDFAWDSLDLPADTMIIDGDGRHLSPGLIDCHSHAATDSGVNEGSQAITAEVRIGDFVDCNDVTIYRQLAGGLTAANVLHGSANPIGGQNQVIKLRWGRNDEQLKFQEAPPGIKFALGENVKRSNSSQPSTRYPGSRMGVDQIIRDAFYNATEYRLRHRQWANRRDGLPPRIDLELEALSEIIDGKRWVHCHSYRQDEILALIRTLDQFQVQIGTFQHIMEGYKVADSMAHHGAMASAFADWWAYKLEVADAIPYGGAIMHDQGVVVSFNSDDGELGRRMNHEAAKAVKYGGVEPAEALKFVTLNPARQLRVDQYVGSLEVGKHADLVVWSGSPLSTLSRVDQTWIEGQCYFDRAEDERWHSELLGWKQTLIQKILDTGASMAAPGVDIDPDPSRDWPRYDEFCRASSE